MPQKHKGNKAKHRKAYNGNKKQQKTSNSNEASSLPSGRRKANSTSQLICSTSSIESTENQVFDKNCAEDVFVSQNKTTAANKNLTNKFQLLTTDDQNQNNSAINVAQAKIDQDSGHSSPNENRKLKNCKIPVEWEVVEMST